jgi:hypothetical protein
LSDEHIRRYCTTLLDMVRHLRQRVGAVERALGAVDVDFTAALLALPMAQEGQAKAKAAALERRGRGEVHW